VSVPSVSYVVLRCADLERSREFYESLGLRLVPEQHGAGSKHYSCDLGGVTLELYPFTGKSTSGLRLGLLIPDLDGALASLRSYGAAVTTSQSAGVETTIVMDPDGHQLSLQRRAG
jgi:catechol 2,3-dioxygenase-like lactoylglutathione lyase family enzyme